MNYIYNIQVNLKESLINFYEWQKEDKIEILEKTKIYYVNEQAYDDILNMRVKFKKEFMSKLNINKILFSNEIEIVCVEIKDNMINKISKLQLDEEKEILEETTHSQTDLKYDIIDKNNNYSFQTRDEIKIKNKIKKFIINKKDNNELISYLYYEWFKSNNKNNKYDLLLNAIDSDFSNKHTELLKIINLLNV